MAAEVMEQGSVHKGVDIAAPIGTPAKAMGAGKVIAAGWQNPKNHRQGYGLRVIVQHKGGNISVYGNLSAVSVKVGQTIEGGPRFRKLWQFWRVDWTSPALHRTS
jgi:murein DD-endopeptidase MepM/ murein hydrolase activator NlpD